jgi:hypothetical protein
VVILLPWYFCTSAARGDAGGAAASDAAVVVADMALIIDFGDDAPVVSVEAS